MSTLSLILVTALLVACEDKEVETEVQSFEEWKADYMNARQSDSTEDVCAEFYQDCVDAGHAEEDCAIRSEECTEFSEREDTEEREPEESESSECDELARLAYEECIEEGGSNEDCRVVYGEVYDDCINSEDGG